MSNYNRNFFLSKNFSLWYPFTYPKIFIFYKHTGWWQNTPPDIGLKCCSGPIFFKTPPTLKNQELCQVAMAKNVIFTKFQKCKQKFLKIQIFSSQIYRLTLGYISWNQSGNNIHTVSVRCERLSKKFRTLKTANFVLTS